MLAKRDNCNDESRYSGDCITTDGSRSSSPANTVQKSSHNRLPLKIVTHHRRIKPLAITKSATYPQPKTGIVSLPLESYRTSTLSQRQMMHLTSLISSAFTSPPYHTRATIFRERRSLALKAFVPFLSFSFPSLSFPSLPSYILPFLPSPFLSLIVSSLLYPPSPFLFFPSLHFLFFPLFPSLSFPSLPFPSLPFPSLLFPFTPSSFLSYPIPSHLIPFLSFPSPCPLSPSTTLNPKRTYPSNSCQFRPVGGV